MFIFVLQLLDAVGQVHKAVVIHPDLDINKINLNGISKISITFATALSFVHIKQLRVYAYFI